MADSKRKADSDAASDNDNSYKKPKQKSTKDEAIPVTLLSGFLGSGKTTLLRYILTSKEHKLRIAVIVNDFAELNVDGQDILRTSQSVVENTQEVITLENGCICCTLRSGLIREIYRIQQTEQFDYVLVESTGIAEPQQVAESFCVDPDTQALAMAAEGTLTDKMLFHSARLDCCVTVVDAVNFPQYLSSLKRFDQVFDDGLEEIPSSKTAAAEGKKSISELMVEQVEFANAIVLNKCDLVSEKTIDVAKKLIATLNPKARVITGSYGKIDLRPILNTGLFDMKEATESPGWLLSLSENGGSALASPEGEADEYGVSSFVFRARRPFHPLRLYLFLKQFFCFAEEWNEKVEASKETEALREEDADKLRNKYGSILRSKGTCWIASRDDHEIVWHQTGRIIQLSAVASWYCRVDNPEEWDGGETEEGRALIESRFYDPTDTNSTKVRCKYGDRRQELVFIGTMLQQEAIESGLRACLLSDTEMQSYATDLPIGSYPDPLLPIHVPCLGAQSLFMIVRHGQNQHLRLYPGFSLTLNSIAWNLSYEEEDVMPIAAVKVWLDKSESHSHSNGVLLATLRPNTYEQHALTLPLLPCDEAGGEARTNRRLRIQVIPQNRRQMQNYSLEDYMRSCEVHVMGKIEPLPFRPSDDSDDEDQDQGADADDEVDMEQDEEVVTDEESCHECPDR